MMNLISRFLLVILSATFGVAALDANAAPLSAFWANDGGDKIAQHELRASDGNSVINRTWDGKTIKIFGAKNEVVNFNLVLEANNGASSPISVTFDKLTGPVQSDGSVPVIRSLAPATPDGVFDWVKRDIELFYVRYLQIKGVSRLSYERYDERHIPFKLRLPKDPATGDFTGGWTDRPNHDAFYPDIAVPIELHPTFIVASGTNQSIWADIYIPPGKPAGPYTGTVTIREGGLITKQIPVQLTVRRFSLPDVPNSKTMVFTDFHQVARRYTGIWEPNPADPAQAQAYSDTQKVLDRQFMLAHRHKISLVDDNGADGFTANRPRPEWLPRLNGSLFTTINGYRGPGTGAGNGVFSIGTYGSWQDSWRTTTTGYPTMGQVRSHTNNWEEWFQANSPNTERFLYLADEPVPLATLDDPIDYAKVEEWAGWVKTNPGAGKDLKTFATVPLDKAVELIPSLNISASWIAVAPKAKYENAAAVVNADPTKDYYFYNGRRPASGSFATEDEGVALRQLPWGQYKKSISRWFFWEATYYKDDQNRRNEADMFIHAQTFGGRPNPNYPNPRDMDPNDSKWVPPEPPLYGLSSDNYSNGDGVLFYPGTDKADPDFNVIGTTFTSYGLKGPIASLRLKHWRRGIQDVDYIAKANRVDPVAVKAIVDQMVPKAMWEVGQSEPGVSKGPISWSTNPDDWEDAREELANIIEAGSELEP